MSDTEVEKTLKEIRERVRVQIRRQTPAIDRPSTEANKARGFESLRANLSIIQRSWNRLPPLTTYRTGWVARLELWCKRLFKGASHWFTFEQVNFNSATSNSLQEVLVALSTHEEALSELKKRLETIASEVAEMQTNLEALATNGRPRVGNVHDSRTLSKSDQALLTGSGNESSSDRHELIDWEIDSLARRIEELRAIKARLD